MELFPSLMKAYSDDVPLMTSLGLQTTEYKREWLDIGTVVVEEAEPEISRPSSTVKVEVIALPTHFWRFTVTRPRDECKQLNDGTWVGLYEPVETIVIKTGSGNFREYWPTAKMTAEHTLIFEVG